MEPAWDSLSPSLSVPVLCSLLAPSGLLAVFGVPWLLRYSDLFLHLHIVLFLLLRVACVQISPLSKVTSHTGLGAHPSAVWPHFS